MQVAGYKKQVIGDQSSVIGEEDAGCKKQVIGDQSSVITKEKHRRMDIGTLCPPLFALCPLLFHEVVIIERVKCRTS